MNFTIIGEWLAMGGHGPYVWSAYGATFVILVANVLVPLWRLRQRLRGIARAGADAPAAGRGENTT